jgi:hypothetical protein
VLHQPLEATVLLQHLLTDSVELLDDWIFNHSTLHQLARCTGIGSRHVDRIVPGGWILEVRKDGRLDLVVGELSLLRSHRFSSLKVTS